MFFGLILIPVVLDSFWFFVIASNAASAANIPLFIALCVPLIFGTFIKPGLQPMRAPPRNANFGTFCNDEQVESCNESWMDGWMDG